MIFKMICRLKNEVIHKYYEAFYAARGLKGALAACSDLKCFGYIYKIQYFGYYVNYFSFDYFPFRLKKINFGEKKENFVRLFALLKKRNDI